MPRKRKPATSPTPHHYAADVTFTVDGTDARRAAVAILGDAVRQRATADDLGDTVEVAVAGAGAAIDLGGTAPELRAHRMQRLADALVVQIGRQTFPDVINLQWGKS